MTQESKDRLKNIKRSRCTICKTEQRYSNPMATCFECRKKFCFDHIKGGQVTKGMGMNELIRDVCYSEKGYSSL
jgi:hypothetical protein